MGNKKREHVVFDRMERVKTSINKKNFNKCKNDFDQIITSKGDIEKIFTIKKTDSTKFKEDERLKDSKYQK